VLQAVLLCGAVGFIVSHNHPSQDPAPSQSDIQITQALKKGAEAVQLRFLDHVIVTDTPGKYYSFQDAGIF
jgi:DNA repair protein RadC